MKNQSENPYIPIIIEEIKSSPVYLRFLQLLRDYDIKSIYDCHAHISSGKEDVVEDAPSELMPRYPFTIGDINYLYDELFRNEGIEFTSLVFDTPLPAYDLASKNDQLLFVLKADGSLDSRKTVPFAVVTPDMDYRQIEEWVGSGARGFKMTPRTASPHVKRGVISDITLTDMLNPEALWIANQHGLPLVVHLPQLVVSPRMKPSLKDELLQIAAKYPNLKIILAHLGQAQTPAKMEDLLALIDLNDLSEIIWMDISAVTVPSVLAMAFESNAKLLFGTDIDFALVERGRYIMFRVADGKRVLVDDDDNGNVITALVSQNFGKKLKSFALESGIILDAPLLLFQFEGILDAVGKLELNGRDQVFIKTVLENLFYRNAETLFSN
ncbi:MAG: amidohydrolase family protein [Chloroflexi bacterium]|nr:amidohydrolase family protein [Chloroflexota bacterium]